MTIVALVANSLIAVSYFGITTIITRGLVRSRQFGHNRLATATAAIFFSCGVGHAIHAVHVLEGGGADLHLAVWDSVTAVVALIYLSLRRSFAALLGGPELFDDLDRRRLEDALAEESAGLAEAQAVGMIGSWSIDLESGGLSCSAEYRRIVGLTEQEAVDGRAWDLVHDADDERVATAMRALMESGVALDEIYRIVRHDGRERVLHGRGRRESDPARVVGTVQDITEMHGLQHELAHATRTLEAVLAHSPTAIYLKDHDQRFLLANEETGRILGRSAKDLVGTSLWDIYPAEVVAQLAAHDAGVVQGGQSVEYEEIAHDFGTGEERTWLSVKFPVYGPAGESIGVGGVSLDITERARSERARRAAEDRFRVAFEQAGVGMAVIRLEGVDRGRVVAVNTAYAEMLGRPVDDLVGEISSSWTHAEDLGDDPFIELATGVAERVQFEQRYMHEDGRTIWCLVTAAVFTAEDDSRLAIGQVLDISERKHFEGRLQHLADHDALTGLFNRRRFEEELERELARAERHGGICAVLALDLDGFKSVNDSLGHAAGDELVARIAGNVARLVRESDIVARTGGDEFAVILPETDEDRAGVVAAKLLAEIRRSGAITSGDRHAQVTGSIGITVFARGSGITADDLLVEADIAMYDAKARGKDCVEVYRRGEQRRERIAARQDWMQRLRTAVEDERFVLHAQPIVPICSGGVQRFELLLRMRDDFGDLIPPTAFLYNAERFDLIQAIDRWVMHQAVTLLHEYHRAGCDIVVSINVSAKTVDAGGIAATLAELLAETSIPDGRLIVEITETAAISNIERARELADDLHRLGCLLALDDFGAGFATFYYLKHLSFDFIKIDGEFIKGLPDNTTDQLVVRAVVDIARGLGADTIAEFVQDDRTLDLLRELGVGYGQGHHTGRPAPLHHQLPHPHASVDVARIGG
jgi:diguanylate cyclase (GGDEF)-like protein/PAS domain S-box-containing protein